MKYGSMLDETRRALKLEVGRGEERREDVGDEGRKMEKEGGGGCLTQDHPWQDVICFKPQ